MKYDINSLAVVPYIIAERAIWNVLEEKYRDLTHEQCLKVVERLTDSLAVKAERLFNDNEHFRLGLLNKRNDQRYYLEIFMEHWVLPLLDKGKINKLL